MLKKLLVGGLLLAAPLALADDPATEFELRTDRLEIDVAHLGDVAVRFEITRRSPSQRPPTVTVVEQTGGFTCQVKSLSVVEQTSGYGQLKQMWRVVIGWEPGSDVSGCELRVSDPSFAATRSIRLFMYYR